MTFQIKPRREFKYIKDTGLEDPKLRFCLKIMLADKGKQLKVNRFGYAVITDMPKRINNNQM